jgi:hypothetical protein
VASFGSVLPIQGGTTNEKGEQKEFIMELP